MHDTPESHPVQLGSGIGVRWLDHVEPFQPSTNGIISPVDRRKDWPTATQLLAEVHDTPLSELSECAGFGAGWIDQPVAAAD